jgi:hypothetical protein
MKNPAPLSFRIVLVALTCVALTSCSLLGDGWRKPAAPPKPAAPVVPADPLPVATHRFTLEDDPRDWKKAEKKLLTKSLSESIRKELKRRGEDVDWERVSSLTHDPRGIPVSISRSEGSLEQVVAAAPRVQNLLPEGASWDGKSDLPMDEQSFKEMVSDSDPQTGPTGTPPPPPKGN